MKKFVIASILAFPTANASATEPQLYLKGSIGRVDPDVNSIADFSESDGYSFIFGYKLNDYFSLEAGRLDLGETKAKGQNSYDYSYIDELDGITYRQSIEHFGTQIIASESIMLGIAASKRIGDRFNAGIQLGAHRWNQTTHYRGRDVGIYSEIDSDGTLLREENINRRYNNKQSKEHNDPYYGGFISWSVKDWSIGLTYTVFELGDRKPTLSALSLTYNF